MSLSYSLVQDFVWNVENEFLESIYIQYVILFRV